MPSIARSLIAGALSLLAVAACSDSPRPYGDRTTPPPSARDQPGAAPTPASPTAPPGVPQDRAEKK